MTKTILAVATAALLASSAAYAADVYQPEPQPVYVDAPEVAVSEASGWYLRGDLGYSFNKLRGANYFQGSNGNQVDFATSSIKDSFWVGGGVGYQINSYLRTDLTFDYLTKADFNGSTRGECGFSATPCTSSDVSSMRAYTLMANAYVDLGTYAYFTPYIGGGIGGSYVKWDKLRNTSCADNGTGCDATVEHHGAGSWRFAYQLMAGASIDVTCNVKADLGYRFRHTAGGDMFGYALNGGPGYDKGFHSHSVHAGARYVFGGCETPVAYEPPAELPVYK
ncbi:MAG: outer membrane beta-barrel protein [Agrobacterium albertimagni]|uniref:Outer surface protein n=1 Tax=Agrobacterium albertimagni AOL15 TaxID=1156935 RepID=K2Q4P7_9HYPH|nr:outer membrane protein [Agrobacterium albertimagni]EKF58704.1 outer surface protein [Agrobacterium albertimagni AOL15]